MPSARQAAVTPTSGTSSWMLSIRMPRRRVGSAADPAASPLFLDGDDGFGVGELLVQAGILTGQPGDLVGERVALHRLRDRPCGCQGTIAALEALAPLGHLGGVQARAPEECAASGITARIGIIFLQDDLALGSGQGQAFRRVDGGGHAILLMPCLKRISEPHLSHYILAHRVSTDGRRGTENLSGTVGRTHRAALVPMCRALPHVGYISPA